MLPRIIGILVITFILLFSVSAIGEDSTTQRQVPYFTNEDIEKYKKPSDGNPQVTKIDKTGEKREDPQKIKEEREKESWCKKATQYKNKKERIQENIADTEKALSRNNLCWKSRRSLNRSLEKQKRQLKYAEKDISDFEDEAHRKGIPPGWLRCQFE